MGSLIDCERYQDCGCDQDGGGRVDLESLKDGELDYGCDQAGLAELRQRTRKAVHNYEGALLLCADLHNWNVLCQHLVTTQAWLGHACTQLCTGHQSPALCSEVLCNVLLCFGQTCAFFTTHQCKRQQPYSAAI